MKHHMTFKNYIFPLSCLPVLIGFILLISCTNKRENISTNVNINQERAQILLDSLYEKYSISGTPLLRESYPFIKVIEVADGDENQSNTPKQYSYLWPYSATFSAINALYKTSGDNKYYSLLKTKVIPGLEEYFDSKRKPFAYASYVTSISEADRYYDDNIWVGTEFVNIYQITKNTEYLNKAKLIWEFILSGIDQTLGGGIYWCEQKKDSKNACSNAPGCVYAFKLFEATKDSTYFYKGRELYEWTKKNLQDTISYLYFDRINPDGEIIPAKYAYNSGQMMQAAALQYKLTSNPDFLTEAQKIAESCLRYFFSTYTTDCGEEIILLKKGDVWFGAVMLRGFIELYRLDNNRKYIDVYKKNLDYAWTYSREKNGLFNADHSGEHKDQKMWLLTQAAMVEMYSRIAAL